MGKDFVRRWLDNHEYCVLATSCDDNPWAATVNYTVDDALNIYIMTRPETLKFQNILTNPRVCLVIDSQTKDGTLQIHGVAEPILSSMEGEPNLRVRPVFLTHLIKEDSGELKRIRLEL